jgi:hypothetical protein
MNSLKPIEDKKSFFKHDTKLIFGLLIFYGFCILALSGTVFWGWGQINKNISLNATSTAVVVSTQHAISTATAIVHATEQAQYKYIDKFDQPGIWTVETVDDEYMTGSLAINAGIYSWNIREVKQPFYYWADSHKGTTIKDFDVYVDSKVIEGDACTGFLFRKSPGNWEDGAYTYSVCNNSYFEVNYYKQGKWGTLQKPKYSGAIRDDGWNRLEINARKNHFIFRINNVIVFEMTDDRLPSGAIALLVDVDTTNPIILWFDNFGLQVP